jgi:hypothetical protein
MTTMHAHHAGAGGLMETANYFVSSGLIHSGYEYVNSDEGTNQTRVYARGQESSGSPMHLDCMTLLHVAIADFRLSNQVACPGSHAQGRVNPLHGLVSLAM